MNLIQLKYKRDKKEALNMLLYQILVYNKHGKYKKSLTKTITLNISSITE